jgi:hypothetical protein
MKGEVLDSHTGWRGNPAKMVRCQAAVVGAASTCSSSRVADEPSLRIAAE